MQFKVIYFQIWNYKIACDVFEEFEADGGLDKLKDRAPFWITMTRQDTQLLLWL